MGNPYQLLSISQVDGLAAALEAASQVSSALDILGQLKTVDGAGSGLDADLFQGYEPSDFLMAGAGGGFVDSFNGRAGAITLLSSDVTGALTFTPLNATAYTAADVFAKVLTLDGSGSGLDADTLDGYHASSFVLAGSTYVNSFNSRTGAVTLTSGDVTGALTYTPLNATAYTAADVLAKLLTVDGAGSGLDSQYLNGRPASETATASSIVARDGSGSIAGHDFSASRGDGSGYIYLGNAGRYFGHDGTNYVMPGAQLAVNGSIVYTTGNDGAGSGLDADLLDGADGSLYARKDQNQQITGTWSFAATPNFAPSGGDNVFNLVHDSAYFSWYNSAFNTRRSYIQHFGTGWIFVNEISGAYTNFQTTGGGQVQVNGNLIWHAGNDGSGSGLDADTLDGYHVSQLILNNATVQNISNAYGFYLNNGRGLSMGYSGGNYGGVGYNVNFSTTSNVHTSPSDDTSSLLMFNSGGMTLWGSPAGTAGRTTVWETVLDVPRVGGMTYRGQTIWTSGIDGAGSGLDADLLDGLHASSFGQLTSAQTWTQNNSFNGVVTTHSYFHANSTVPYISMYDTDGTANARYSAIIQNGDSWSVNFMNDGWSASTTPLSITRSGHTATSAYWTLSGAMYVNGAVVWTSGIDGAGSGLDADLLDGLHAAEVMPFNTLRDFTIGTLVTTDIDYSVSSGDPFLLTIKGNSYNELRPVDTQVQGYIYSDTIINTSMTQLGHRITGLVAINNGGKLCFWWPRQGYWHGYQVTCITAYPGTQRNKVLSVTDVAQPTTAKQVNFSGSTTERHIDWEVNSELARSIPVRDSDGYMNQRVIRNTGPTSDGMYIGYANAGAGVTRIYGGGSTNTSVRVGISNTYWFDGSTDHVFWHAGNDGAGSGLDADLLDGMNPSITASGNSIAQRDADGSVTFRDIVAHRNDNTGVIYLGNLQNRYLYFDGSSYNLPGSQLIINGSTAWNAGNDGSGSGLDADMIDGLHSTSFMRNDVSGAFNSNQSASRIVYHMQSTQPLATVAGAIGPMEIFQPSSSSGDSFIAFHNSGRFGAYFGLVGANFYTGGWSYGANQYMFWTQYNDGSGSGLDADLLEGYHASFAAYGNYIPIRDGSGMITAGGGPNGGFTSGPYIGGTANRIWAISDALGYGLSYFQGAAGFNSGDSIGFHFGTVTTAGSVVSIYSGGIGFNANSASIGPNLSSSYGPVVVRGARTGWNGIHFEGGGNAPHIMFSGATGGIYFETTGRWAQYYHHANDCWGIGTTSTDASYSLYLAKGLYSTGRVDAPIFYDINNTAYYVDINSTSRMNSILADRLKSFTDIYTDANYGHGLVGLYTSTVYQGVFAMGDSYKLPANGSSTGNLYGIAWSHPNAGGIAANLNSHGALFLENGAFMAAISGSIRARDDIRAPQFYDSNDTSYYLDLHSTSMSNDFRANIFYDRIDTSYYMQPRGTSLFNDLRANIFYDRLNTGYYVVPREYSNMLNVQANSIGVGTGASGSGGDVRAAGNITAYYSDRRLKENIEVIQDPIAKIMMISGVTYNSNDLAAKYGYKDKKRQVGVIAQEIAAVLPEVVVPAPFDRAMNLDGTEYSISGEDYQTVQYEKLVPLLIEAAKAQQALINSLQDQINALKKDK